MRYNVIGKRMEVTPALDDKVGRKLHKLERYFDDNAEAKVTLSAMKNRHIVELTIVSSGLTFRAEDISEDMYTSIDTVIDLVIRQVRKNRTRLEKKIHEGSIRFDLIEDSYDDEIDNEDEFKIERYKTIDAKPMTVEEAILQMNLVGHAFYVFMNAENEKVCVVYKRKAGAYGLIEPEF